MRMFLRAFTDLFFLPDADLARGERLVNSADPESFRQGAKLLTALRDSGRYGAELRLRVNTILAPICERKILAIRRLIGENKFAEADAAANDFLLAIPDHPEVSGLRMSIQKLLKDSLSSSRGVSAPTR